MMTRLSSRLGVFGSNLCSCIIAAAVARHRLPQISWSYEDSFTHKSTNTGAGKRGSWSGLTLAFRNLIIPNWREYDLLCGHKVGREGEEVPG
jgi:hypothetical protein